MSRLYKAIIFGFLAGISGIVISFVPSVLNLEEKIGLDLLFKMRGQRQAPPDVIVVSIDKFSANKLSLSNKPEKWPHSLHAHFTENLVKEGAGVIAFDVFFNNSRSIKDDILFANTINRAQNVVLVASIKREKIVLKDEKGLPTGDLNIEKIVPPISPLFQSSAAIAPFPLPKVPVKVSQYWAFKTSAGDTPTLPIVVFQVFALEVYDEFIQLLGKSSHSKIDKLPPDKDAVITNKSVIKVIQSLREIFEKEPQIAERMLEELRNSRTLFIDSKKKKLLKSLIRMYQSSDSQYLNFYGPPRTITTIPYYEILQLQKKSVVNQKLFDFNGKAVFVGSSEKFQPEQQDGYYTVFSESSGLDISGVEIAATAFANLVEDMSVQQLPIHLHLFTVFILGMIIGTLCRQFPATISLPSVIGIGMVYLIAVLYQFKMSGIWYPLVVPLFFQVPFVFFCALTCKYIDSNKERQNIKKAFKYYLPSDMVEELSKNIADVKTRSQIVYGTCLSTDAGHYTSLSETMHPKELSSFINKYYEVVFDPIKQRGGIVSNVVGDSVFAIWVTKHPDVALRKQACLAALDIESAVHQFNQSSNAVQLPTRISLHFGHILLGNIGAIDHYEYRPVGDIVNTATRIEGLNKYLDTRILLSKDMMNQLDGFLTRELGKFLFVGKSKPIVVHELICRMEETTRQQRSLCVFFSEALEAFKRQFWEEATEKFHDIINRYRKDGPSLFYLKLCEQYREKPPAESWNGVICLDKK